MIEVKFIKSDKLKSEANKIFKGLIKEAYIEIFEFDPSGNNRRKEYFNTLDVEKQKELGYDSETIVFEFENGAIVEFSNSEWASMEVFDNRKLETDKE